MPNYQQGKIYRIICQVTGKQYIGHTTHPLPLRLKGHVTAFKQWKQGKGPYMSSFEVIKNGDCEISLIEEFPCNTVEELERREAFFITSIDCVNLLVPGGKSDKKERVSTKRKSSTKNSKETNSTGEDLLQKYNTIRPVAPIKSREYASASTNMQYKWDQDFKISKEAKLQEAKFGLLHYLSGDIDKLQEAKLFFEVYTKKTRTEWVPNCYAEKKGYVDNQHLLEKLQVIQHIVRSLQVKHSQDTDKLIPRQLVESMTAWVNESRGHLSLLFCLRDRNEKETRSMKNVVDTINKVLYKWSGSRLTPQRRDRNRRALDYHLTTEYHLYDYISD